MAVARDLLNVRCKSCQAILPGSMRLANTPHSSLLLHHLGAMHPDEAKPYIKRMEHECIAKVLMELFEKMEQP